MCVTDSGSYILFVKNILFVFLQSSQLAEPLLTDPGLKSRISERKLISTLK